MLVVLGDEIRDYIDENDQEQWLTSYIGPKHTFPLLTSVYCAQVSSKCVFLADLLSRFELYTIANLVVKLSCHGAVETLNQRSTRLRSGCARCNKQMQRVGWLCERCSNRIQTCAIW